jgi:hypothetical protein
VEFLGCPVQPGREYDGQPRGVVSDSDGSQVVVQKFADAPPDRIGVILLPSPYGPELNDI